MCYRLFGVELSIRQGLPGYLVCVLLFGGLPALLCQAPDYVVQKWTAADGLPNASVHGLARSKNGFLWLNTDRGVARFDGVQFSGLRQKDVPELETGECPDMVVGPDSQLYIAKAGGMIIVGKQGAKIVRVMSGAKPDAVQVVLPVGNDEAWFGTEDGSLYHYHGGATERIGPKSLSGETVYGLSQSPDGRLWIGTGNGLFLFAHGEVSRYRPRRALPISGFFDLAITDAGSIFAATDRGVLQIDGGKWRLWNTRDGLPGDHIQVLAAAPGNVLWIGTTSGLARLAHGQVQTIKTQACIVGGLNLDPDNSVWVGCEHTGGLLHVLQPVAQLHSPSKTIPILRVSSLVEDKAGVVWMASIHGLLRWQNGHSRLYATKDGLVPEVITNVSLAPDGSVWMATDDGFARLHKGKIETYRTQRPGPPDPVFSVLEDSKGTLWVGTPKALLSRPRGQTKLQVVPSIQAKVWSIREDREGNIWISTADKGLYRVSGSSQTRFTMSDGLASNKVSDTLEDANGDIWVATNDGLSRIRDGKCKSIQHANGVPIGHIDAFASDLLGRLWLRVPDAVLTVDIGEANSVIDRRGVLANTHLYGADDGFRDQLLHVSAGNGVIRNSSGKMWFATEGGFGSIDPSTLSASQPRIIPMVTSFASDAGEHELGQMVSVEPGDLRVEAIYTSPTMNGAKSLEFRYQLVGFDKAWRPAGKDREAVYTSLTPGRYHFHISVRRPFGPWIDSSTALEIRIVPHFYQTWWWYALLAVTLASAMLLGYQIRLKEIRRQFATLMAERLRERSRLARELHDTLAQGMVGIHFQIEAAQVLLDVDPQSVRKHLESVGRIAREASIETRKSIAELRSEESQDPSPSAVLMEAAFHFTRTNTIDLLTDIGDDLPRFSPEVMHEISRFLEEALANVRVHSQAQHAYLSAHNSEKTLVLRVADDGKGFSVDASKGTPGHFGLTGMMERASRINGSVHIASQPGKGQA